MTSREMRAYRHRAAHGARAKAHPLRELYFWPVLRVLLPPAIVLGLLGLIAYTITGSVDLGSLIGPAIWACVVGLLVFIAGWLWWLFFLQR
jgi:hypothetical protein